VRVSSAYFAWGGVFIYFLILYLLNIHPLLLLLNMLLFQRLFRMGESDYLDDNLMQKHFSGKEKSIFSLRIHKA